MRKFEECTVMITGATDGLGRKLAEDLAQKGMRLLLHGRNPEKAEQVMEEIRRQTGNAHLHYFNADLSRLQEVRRLADSVTVSQPRIDVLINNAGLGAGPDTKERQESPDGYELRLAVNYLAPYLLTRQLIPLLKKGAEEGGEARIVNVASAAQQPIDFDDPMLKHNYDGMRAYSQSKLAMILWTFDLAAELEDFGISVNALHPASLMDTRMVREWFGSPRTSVEEGARYVERLVLSDELSGVTGRYFDQSEDARAESQAYDDRARKKLRELTRRWCGMEGE